MIDTLGYLFFPFFVLIYGVAAYSDFTRKRVNALGFYFLKGLVYTGIFLAPGKSIIVALLLSFFYFLFSFFHEKLLKQKFFSGGDFTMLMPFSLATYLFLDVLTMGFVHLFVLVFGLVWFIVVKDRGFAPILLVSSIFFFIIRFFI